MSAALAGPVLAAGKEILGIESGGFVMIVVSLVALLLGVPIAARLGNSDTTVFRRTGVVYGAFMLVLLFGAFLIVKQTH